MPGTTISIPPNQPQFRAFNILENEDTSPTRVIDFARADSDKVSIRNLNPLSSPPAVHLFHSSIKKSSGRRSRQRRSESKINLKLPTLDETSECNSSPVESCRLFNVERLQSRRYQQHHETILSLLADAAELAAIGKESEALQIYSNAIDKVSHLSKKLKRAFEDTKLHQPIQEREMLRQSIQLDIRHALMIAGKSLFACTRLHELSGSYDLAISTCQESQKVYNEVKNMQPVNNLVQGQFCQDESIEELLLQINETMQQLKIASDLYSDRQYYVNEVIAIRKLMNTTSCSKNRSILYRQVTNHMKTLMKLERLSLGNDHPQIADSLRLQSVITL